MILAGKYFGIVYECVRGSIYFKVSPGEKGMFQMPPSEVAATQEITKVRILVEQDIFDSKHFV